MLNTSVGNRYEIHPQSDTPEIDMYNHLQRWRQLLVRCLGRDLNPDDYLFPFIAPNGIIHSTRAMRHGTVQDMIAEFAKSAGLTKIFTTHSFRRGGAQYRFMYAPLGQRWSLSIIRWWGGWAIGEHVGVLRI